MITADQFARALVERLSPILPAGFTIDAHGDLVIIAPRGGEGGSTALAGLLDVEGVAEQDYADAVWAVLSMAQDVVSETTVEPWPAPLANSSDLAEPGARAGHGQIILFFGDEAQPVLTLPPIGL